MNFLNKLGSDQVVSGNTLSTILEIDGFSEGVGSNEQEIVLVDGDLTIDQNFEVARGGLALFVVSGNITVNGDVTQVEGLFVADGSITVLSGTENQLNLEGSYVADANSSGIGQIVLQRDLGTANAFEPAVVFTFRPDLIVELIKQNIALDSDYEWQEMSP